MGNGNGRFGGREVVIVEAARTPIGRGHPEKGYYKDNHPSNLLAKTYSELIEHAWIDAGLPIETPATTIDRQCGSAQQAVNFAAAQIASGVHDTVIGSGVEHMGHIPMGVGFKWVDEVGS